MSEELLALHHVCLAENGNEELNEVNFSLYAGDILGLISLDNQGYTVLLDLIMNNRRLDRGHMFFRGKEVSGYLKHSSEPNKVALIESESHLIPALNIADNFFSAKKAGPWLINPKKQNQQIRMIFEPYGIQLSGDKYPESLSLLDRCRVEIIKAKTIGCKVIILRDPTSFLGPKEVRCLQELIRQIAAADGVSFIYLCNHHQELMSVCTRLIIMYSGTVLFNKEINSVTDDIMTTVSNDFIKSMPRLHKPAAPSHPEELAVITGSNGFHLSVFKGECLVLLDLDNKAVPQISDALFEPYISLYRIFIDGKEASRNPRLWSFVPANPVSSSLFPNMSYIDNLTLKNCSRKMPQFWLSKRYRRYVAEEYKKRIGSAVNASTILSLSQRELYELIYRRIEIEHPKILFIVQPFNRMDMYQRIRILEYIADLQRRGITIVILAISLSDSLQVASRLVLLQNHRIEQEFTPDRFDMAAAYGLIVR